MKNEFDKLLPDMKKIARLKNHLLSPSSAILAIISAALLILAFPGFEISLLAWFALVPLFFAIGREKDSIIKSFLVGWLFGTLFFFGTCWWLTFALITYAAIPWFVAYFFLFCATSAVAIFPAIFAALFSILLKRFGNYAILSAPFFWTFTEFLRMWLTGNNWNAIGYSQAFGRLVTDASFGGVYSVGFQVVVANALILFFLNFWSEKVGSNKDFFLFGLFRLTKNQETTVEQRGYWAIGFLVMLIAPFLTALFLPAPNKQSKPFSNSDFVIAVQPNVPMSGLTLEKYRQLLERHIQSAENALEENLSKFVETQTETETKSENSEKDKEFYSKFYREKFQKSRKVVIFPESPMMFTYGQDEDLQKILRDFAVRNNASVLINSAELTRDRKRSMNSAVMIDATGEKNGQYDKIHLLPFGEYMPLPDALADEMPAFVGNFQSGDEYDLLPFGDAQGGVMICFESHFGELSREYARRGADVLIEMTNDGYLGNTPVLRQHLANSVFRAVETNRPLIRVTNVGITAYINECGEVLDAADVYTQAARVWTISKSDGGQTLYVRYGDWFAWACSIISLGLMFFGFISTPKRRAAETAS